MPPLTVTDLFRFPVKSLRGHALDQAAIGPRGIDGDRRWMLVDQTGRFLTRREVPEMALFDVEADHEALLIRHPVHGSCHIPRPDEGIAKTSVSIWGETMCVRPANDASAAYLSHALGRPVRLVYQGDETIRPVDPTFAAPGDQVSLSDGFPLLLVTKASLDALNAELALPVAMARFRPNIVVAGADAWREDHWRRIRIGNVTLRLPKPCSRCIITTQDSLSGVREHGNEPLSTLLRIGRMGKGGVMFGQNAIPENSGTITTGDLVEILEEGASNLS